MSIQKMNACWIGRIAVGHEDDLLAGGGGSDRFIHGNNGGLCTPVVRNMVGGDFQVFGGDEEKNILMFPQDPDIGFIPR